MISFEQFEKVINTLEHYSEKDRQLMDLIGDGIGTYTCDMSQVLVDLLKFNIDNEDEWIEWWIWDCDFGKSKHCLYREKDSKEDIFLNDIKVFYHFLLSLKK